MRAEHRRILVALFTVGVFVAMAKMVGAAKEVVVAARFGTGRVVDAYAFLLSLVNWPAAAWTSAISALLVPLIVRLDIEDGAGAGLFRRELLGLTLWLSAVVGVLSYLTLRVGFAAGFLALPPAAAAAARQMLGVMAACTPLMMIVGVLAAFLMAGQRHTNSLLEAVTPMAIGVTTLAAAGAPVWALPLGTLLGYLLQATLSVGAQPSGPRSLAPRFTMTSPAWKLFWANFPVLLLSQLILAASAVVDQTMAAHLGDSANAALAYANRLMSLVLTLSATVIARSTLPVLSQARMREPGSDWRIAKRWAQALAVLGLTATVVGWLGAPFAVKLLFQRGAFTASDTALVSTIVRFSLLQLPFYLPGMVLVQTISSASLYKTFLVGNVINLAVKVGLNLMLIPRFGLVGAVLGTVGMQIVSAAFLWLASQRRHATGVQAAAA